MTSKRRHKRVLKVTGVKKCAQKNCYKKRGRNVKVEHRSVKRNFGRKPAEVCKEIAQKITIRNISTDF